MLNKLGKTITSKLGGKPSTPGTPQHLQNYQNYQSHQGQQHQPQIYQPQSQTFNPHLQQPQQQPQQQTPQGSSTHAPQYSHHQQSNHASPPGHSGQNSYFPQPTSQAPNTQSSPTPQHPNGTSGYNNTHYSLGGNMPEKQHMQTQQGQSGQGPTNQSQGQGFQNQGQGQGLHQSLQAHYSGQQTGVIGGPQHSGQFQHSPSSHIPNASPHLSGPSAQQSQWGAPSPNSTSSPQTQQQRPNESLSAQSYQPAPSPSNQQGHQQYWMPTSPVSPVHQAQNSHPSPSVSPTPPLPADSKPTAPSNVSPVRPQPSVMAPKPVVPHSASTEFIAELPGDMESLSFSESKRPENPPATAAQASPYQAYQSPSVQSGPPSQGFNIPRRAVSISNAPFADPWRFADPFTELPTREFYVIADILFDALDRKFEPQNTGMLEASKILNSWVELTDDAKGKHVYLLATARANKSTELFSYRSYSAIGKMWSLEGVPHVMVPSQPSLTPIWNFNQQSHSHEIRLLAEPPSYTSVYATYMPALNRAGWYKFFFLEIMHEPSDINKLLPTLCADTYKPGILHHPDLAKRDRAEAPALQAKAAAIQTEAIKRVCDETKAAMLAESGGHAVPNMYR
jgi:hypothetical protein